VNAPQAPDGLRPSRAGSLRLTRHPEQLARAYRATFYVCETITCFITVKSSTAYFERSLP
jgi:hypothetical protein